MAESSEDRVARRLREGLDHYGYGESDAAIIAWREVLELDPQNAEACDYLESADGRSVPRESVAPEPPPAARRPSGRRDRVDESLEAARDHIASNDFEGALALLSAVAESDRLRLDLEGVVDLLRARLLAGYRERIGELNVCPALSQQVDDFGGLNLPKSAGFLISLLDGNTSVTDLVSLSGMDAFEALSTLAGLVDAGVVELPA